MVSVVFPVFSMLYEHNRSHLDQSLQILPTAAICRVKKSFITTKKESNESSCPNETQGDSDDAVADAVDATRGIPGGLVDATKEDDIEPSSQDPTPGPVERFVLSDGDGAHATAEPPKEATAGTKVEGAGSAAEEGKEDEALLVERFNSASSMGKKLFTGGRYDAAAAKYGEALAICDVLEGHEQKRITLHNNRSAAYEKAGHMGLALAECSLCLSLKPTHGLARVRKSRVLQALGKKEEALAELCAHMLLEREAMQAKVGRG
ncbi:unnamed protein product [Discosporangium mesarthrocarpum]